MEIIDREKIMVLFYVILISYDYRFCSEHLYEWLLSIVKNDFAMWDIVV